LEKFEEVWKSLESPERLPTKVWESLEKLGEVWESLE
jgi:hypothetical protein